MQRGLSTHVFLQQRLHAGMLDAMRRAGATAVEIFAARHHFDYTDRAEVREIAGWFRDTGTTPTLHQPLYDDARWSRHVAPTLNLIDAEKSRRIAAMDETKRAIEAAEQIPFRSVVLHLGMKGDAWGMRALENSFTAIEHLRAFAAPLGVQLLLENLPNEVTTPEHLLEILRQGHFDTVGVCLDVGHAHLTDWKHPGAGIDAAFELLKPRIVELHLHDNDGAHDDHCWPGTAKTGIDWKNVYGHTSALPAEVTGVLEIAHDLGETTESIERKVSSFYDSQARLAEGAVSAGEAERA